MTFTSLVPTIECLADETVLLQAWKKTASYIRYHNWFSDTLELDRTAVNLREFISKISAEIKSEAPLLSNPIRMVPAPKSQKWRIEGDGQWKPVDGNGDTAKIRPLAHVSLRDQVIATAIMMCLADRIETRQGDPAIPLDSAELHTVVSYGNRLFSDFKNGSANQRWGSGTLYRGFYEDYQTFLARPEDVAERVHRDYPRTLIVQSDLRQFYDRVTSELLHEAIIADNLADMVPKTNPFLKELFGNFLKIGGRDKRRGLDFDELGVRDVVDVLNEANMEAVLRDFGDRNPKEDPVIHFYELFLKEYDPKKRMQRGVFYTPRPVVNFIVRGVDEILRTEFGLPLGLADTSTWAEVAARNDRITIPAHVKPDAPFVQILDPATGTFLVEVIDLIHKRMVEHWKGQGKTAAEIKAAWNAYVPAHLLPRLTAFELMMAPYTIAHMKVGLKLSETGYTWEHAPPAVFDALR